jgi:hypothetical protein
MKEDTEGTEFNELEIFNKFHYQEQIAHILEHAVKLNFPLIKDLSIYDEEGILNLSFTTGATKEEVEDFLNGLRK